MVVVVVEQERAETEPKAKEVGAGGRREGELCGRAEV